MKNKKTVILVLLVSVLLVGCGEKVTSQDNAVTDDTDFVKVDNPKADEWYVKSIEEYNRQATKEILVYDVVDGEEMKEDAITYIIDKDEKTAKMKKAGDGEKAIDAAEEILSLGDIDLTYVTDYEVMGEEEMDGRKMIAVKMTEEGYLTAAEEADNKMGDKLQTLLDDSEVLRQAYDECLAEQMREKYVWFDAQTKEPQWVEIDITKDQMFRDVLEGIIAEIPEEEVQTVRVIECSTVEEKELQDEELPGEPLVIKTK